MAGKIKIGKVLTYDDYLENGKIIDSEGAEFLFLKNDINVDQYIAKNDIVQFRGDFVGDDNRAYFVKKIDLEKIEDLNTYLEAKNNLNGKILYLKKD